ncbi:MAG: hypothetical protein ABEI77_02380 [Halorientalis sp.]
MGSDIRRSEVCSPFQLEPPTCKPPLELVKDGYAWVVEEFQRGSRNGTTFSTHESRVDAMRAAKERMQTETYPCLLRWDSQASVGGLYWNPVFEDLAIRYDDLLGRWVVVPEADHVLFHVADDQATAYEYGKAVQREYAFKRLLVYDHDDDRQATRDHWFIRKAITDSGVTFKRATRRTPETTDEEPDEQSRPTVPSALGTSITDLTEVEILGTDGVLHRYEAPWTDGQPARILALAPEHGSNQQLLDAFWELVDAWDTHSEDPSIATVLDTGENPTPWVSYRAGEYALAEVYQKLSTGEKVNILGDVSSALSVASDSDTLVSGITPRNVRLVAADDGWTGTVATWGLDWVLSSAIRQVTITPYTAPEQISGKRTDTTAVYQLGAVAYLVFCEAVPFAQASNLKQAIQTGDLTTPQASSQIPAEAADAIETAMAPRPEDRYETVQEFYYALRERLDNTPAGV